MQPNQQRGHRRTSRKERFICLSFCSFAVFFGSGCNPFKVVAEVVTTPIKLLHNTMYSELEKEEMRHAQIRARGIELENMKREEITIGGNPLNTPVDPPPEWVEPEME